MRVGMKVDKQPLYGTIQRHDKQESAVFVTLQKGLWAGKECGSYFLPGVK